MVFYVSLFVVCMIMAGITVWMVRSLTRVGKAYYQAILPSAREHHQTETPETIHMSAEIETMSAPWGWAPTRKRRQNAPVRQPAPRSGPVPWGWPGNPKQAVNGEGHGTGRHFRGEADKLRNDWLRTLGPGRAATASENSNSRNATKPKKVAGLGWPKREGGFEFGGEIHHYQVIDRPRPTRGRLVKPWGW